METNNVREFTLRATKPSKGVGFKGVSKEFPAQINSNGTYDGVKIVHALVAIASDMGMDIDAFATKGLLPSPVWTNEKEWTKAREDDKVDNIAKVYDIATHTVEAVLAAMKVSAENGDAVRMEFGRYGARVLFGNAATSTKGAVVESEASKKANAILEALGII